MPQIKVNLSNVDMSVPAGVYPAVVSGTYYHVSGAGNPSIRWVLSVNDSEFRGRELSYYTGLGQSALWRFWDVMKALGIGEEILDDQGDLLIAWDEDTQVITSPNVIGKPCRISVIEGSYEGRKRAEIDDIFPSQSVPEKGRQAVVQSGQAPIHKDSGPVVIEQLK